MPTNDDDDDDDDVDGNKNSPTKHKKPASKSFQSM